MRLTTGIFGLLALSSVVALAPSAHAQTAGALDGIITQFQNVSTGWQGPLRAYAANTFYTLALISLVRSGFALAFRNADLSEWLAELVNQIFYLGFFYLLLENSATYGTAIIQSFRTAAASAGGTALSPTDVFNAGMNLCFEIYQQLTLTHVGRDVMLAMGGMIVLASYAFIAAEMLIALVESYVVISASVIFMAFGALNLTKEIAISVLRYTFSVGAKLFILQLLVSVGQGFINNWTASFTTFNVNTFLVVIGCSMVLFLLVKQLPHTIQGIINGSHAVGGGGGLIGAAAFVASTAVAVGAAAAGQPVAAMQAARLAAAQNPMSPETDSSASSKALRMARIAGGTGSNLAKAAAADVGRRLSGQSSGRGSAPWRIATDLAVKRRLLNEEQDKPRPPGDDNNPPNSIS